MNFFVAVAAAAACAALLERDLLVVEWRAGSRGAISRNLEAPGAREVAIDFLIECGFSGHHADMNSAPKIYDAAEWHARREGRA